MAVGPAGLPLPAVAPTASPAPRTCVDEGARRAVVDRGRQRSTLRPHPPIKGYCERRRFEETPQRLRAIHRGIAQALARRGRVAEALRHAAEARDTALLGRFAESTGGVRLWLEQDLEGLRTVDGLLTAEVLSAYPRLALVRCVTLTAAGDIDGGSGCTARRPRRRPASRGTARAATTGRCRSTTSSCRARSTCAAASPCGAGSSRR